MELPIEVLTDVIQRGTILYSTIFEDIGHGKFFVVIGISEETIAGFFYINSKINPNVNTSPEQLRLQFAIHPKDYPFLAHESFICATKIRTFNKQIMAQSIQAKETQIKGQLFAEHLSDLLTLVRSSRLFKEEEKRTFFSDGNIQIETALNTVPTNKKQIKIIQ